MAGGGPFVQAALVCEKLLSEQDGVISAVRIIDRMTFGTDEDGNLIQPRAPLTLLVAFKADAARGSFPLELVREKPSGERDSVLSTTMFLEGEDRGANLILNVLFEPDQQGLYWFDVLVQGELATRIPLRAIYQALPTVPGGG